jgi:hypothetical protein
MTTLEAVSHVIYPCNLGFALNVPQGSTTVHPYNNTAYEPVELGASIFVRINKNIWRATEEFNLSRYGFEDEDGDMAIWDGEQILFTVWFLAYIYYLDIFNTFLPRCCHRTPGAPGALG